MPVLLSQAKLSYGIHSLFFRIPFCGPLDILSFLSLPHVFFWEKFRPGSIGVLLEVSACGPSIDHKSLGN